MKVLHTIAGLSASSGGPSTCTHDLLNALYVISKDIKLVTLECRDRNDVNLGKGEPWLIELGNDSFSPMLFSNNFRQYLTESDFDIYHCNAIWLYPNHITCKTAYLKKKPYVISTHGMLYPTALSVKHWKKALMLKMWFENDIAKASCLHATCMQELDYCRKFGYKGPIAVIPNPVVIPSFIQKNSIIKSTTRTIGFLGRLDPIKKIENVIYAISMLTNEERNKIQFQIMGQYDQKYEDFLKKEVARLDLKDSIQFLGFVSGENKYSRLASLWALMVPSAQENFGMIVPEALICNTPVYASLGTPWEELEQYGCGWWKDNSPATIASIIRNIINTDDSIIMEMGFRGRQLIESHYEQQKVALMMYDLYRWLLGEINKPAFVYEI